MYIPGDTTKKAFLGYDTSAHPSDKYELAYVYTMPCKAKINIALTAKVAEAGGDGIVGYAYVNNASNMVIKNTVITASNEARALTANNLVLNKGDKIYFVYSMNQNIQKDDGNFYAKVSFIEIDPKGDGSDKNSAEMPTAGTNSFSHGSIKYSDAYPYWSYVAISQSTGKESALVQAGEKLYVPGDNTKKAYLGYDTTAHPSDEYDMAYVYTMPCSGCNN